VSRATVRKVIRGHQTEFKYARDIQPTPKLGIWVEALTEILETESKLPKRERRSTQRLFEELRGRGYEGAHDSVHRFHKAWRDEPAGKQGTIAIVRMYESFAQTLHPRDSRHCRCVALRTQASRMRFVRCSPFLAAHPIILSCQILQVGAPRLLCSTKREDQYVFCELGP
jgi:hypothetical protein